MDRDDERRLTITIQPQPSDDGLLKVNDALQQVLDYLKVVEVAGQALTQDPQQAVVWKLESASTNSPLTIVMVAESRNSSVDVVPLARQAKQNTAMAFRQIRDQRSAPAWLTQDARVALRSVFQRNLNGVARTRVQSHSPDEVVEITSETAAAGVETLKTLSPLAEMDIPPRRLVGEIVGHLLGVGTYHNSPSLTIISAQYGRVICSVPHHLVEQLGGEKTLEDVWKHRSVAVSGTLVFGAGGVLTRVIAESIRDRTAPSVDLDAVLDPNFTDGLEPVEYIDQLHDGYRA